MRFKINRILKNIPFVYDLWLFIMKIHDCFYYKKHCSNYKIIPFGNYCLPRVICTLNLLKPRKFYKEKTLPFDLAFCLDFDSNIKFLDNKFENFFDDIEFSTQKGMWVNKKSDITFCHDLNITLDELKSRYKTRIENLYDYINDKSKHLYFITAISSSMEEFASFKNERYVIDQEKITKFINTLKKYRNENDFDLIVINQSTAEIDVQIKNVHIINLCDDKDFAKINTKGNWVAELNKQKLKEARNFYQKLTKELKKIIAPQKKLNLRKLPYIYRISFKFLFLKFSFQNPLYMRRIKKLNQKYEIKNTKEPVPEIISKEDTIEELLKTNKSLARFGDGEFALIEGANLGFQDSNKELIEKLKNILVCDNKNLLVGIPDIFSSLDNYTKTANDYWRHYIALKRKDLYKILNLNKKYCNSFLSRPYMIYKNKKDVKKYYDKIKLLWKDKNIVIAEGEFSRLGLNNDLFDGAKSLKRIICPAKSAYSKYSEILNCCKTFPSDTLFILALGPSATALADDLSKCGARALDLGNLDIEYEWFLRKAKKKIAIKNKFVWEALGGTDVKEENDPKYLEQIAFDFTKN